MVLKPTSRGTAHEAIGIPELTYDSDFEGEIMYITVIDKGITKKHHTHKHILQKRSPYFAALTGFREGEENRITLSKINHRAFRQVLHWMYTRTFQPGLLFTAHNMIRTWIVADRLMMSLCKNMVLDEIRSLSKEELSSIVGLRELDELGYGPESTIVRYLLDQIAWDAIFDEEGANIPTKVSKILWVNNEILQQLLRKVILTARELEKSEKEHETEFADPASLEGCQYHDHAEDEGTCYLAKEEQAKGEPWIA